MAHIKVQDIAYVRFSAPDLPKMQAFLQDFGLTSAEDGGDEVLRMRGAGPDPFLHETVAGPAGVEAIGFRAESISDLERLAAKEGLKVETSSRPGGGYLVKLDDPDGIRVEVVAGQQPAPALETVPRHGWNTLGVRGRTSERPLAQGPAMVTRLGHAVLAASDVRRSEQWWKDRFGFITSDEVLDDDGQPVALFMRCDKGLVPTDHHTFLISQMGPDDEPGLHHMAFEVQDFDDLMTGHEHLKSKGYAAAWGVGRHVLGGQVFDYWLDPFGNRLEHWTDGDLFVAEDGSRVVSLDRMFSNHWGPQPSEAFLNPALRTDA